jgi:hypothetical protein
MTIPSRSLVNLPPTPPVAAEPPALEPAVKGKRPRKTGALRGAPWLVQQFMDGEIDLDAELTGRFPTMPLMSILRTRTTGSRTRRGVATLATQDGAAMLIAEVETESRALHLSFVMGSMLSLRFQIDSLKDDNRHAWLTDMRSKQDAPLFLWGETRWETDYLVCQKHKYFTNLFAFSPLHIEAGARLTPEVTRRLIDWLQGYWMPDATFHSSKLRTNW